MANKKFQNNQNRKNTESPAMNGNNSTTTAMPIQNVSQSFQNLNVGSINSTQHNNNPATSSGSATPTASSTASNNAVTPAPHSNQSQNQQHHQKTPFIPTSSQQTTSSKHSVKKPQQNEVEKILLQINNSSGGHGNQGNSGFRSSGNRDQKVKEKEKENLFRNYSSSGRQGNQPNYHHHANHSTVGASSGNQQNHRKKDNKFQNRDHSNQSHRGGGFTSSYGNHIQHSVYSGETGKSTRFPSNSSLSSVGNTSSTTISGPPNSTLTPVIAAGLVNSVPTTVTIEKTVQTDDIKIEEKERSKTMKREVESSSHRSSDPMEMDTVMAFQEHDEWNRVELMCELLLFLSPTDLRLLANCVDGLTRAYTNQMLPHEIVSNGNDPISCFPSFICAPRPQSPPTSSPAISETADQRSVVNNMLSHPPGLPPLIPNIAVPTDGSFPPSSSSTVSPIRHTTNEACNGVTSVTGSNTASSDNHSQDAQSSSAKTNLATTSSLPPTKTSELENAPAPTPMPARSSSTSGKQSEGKVPQDPEKFLPAIRDLTNYLYILISVCSSTNRRSAAKIADYVGDVLLKEKTQILERIPNELDKIDVIQDIGKLVAALTHHPAVSLDDKIKYGEMRDGLRTEIESLFQLYYSPEKTAERRKQVATSTRGVGDLDGGAESDDEDSISYFVDRKSEEANYRPHGHNTQTLSTTPGTFFITRFIGRQVERNDNLFSLEIHWSDGDKTFTQRTKDQLKALQHRLLDEFGQQRSEKYHHGMSSSFSSFDEESKKLSTSTSTMEMAFSSSGERIVPRLPCDATPVQLVQYINELSDLPARMMLSTVICEEFNGTRARTDDEEARDTSDGLIFSRWKNPHAKTPDNYYNRDAAGNIEAQEFPKSIPPFLYSNIQSSHPQYLPASCSNCGGLHHIKHCDKPTLHERRGDHKLRFEPDGGPLPAAFTTAQLAAGAAPVAVYPPMHPPIHHQMFLENQAMMNANHHFNHHQQQQILQNNIYTNGGQFRNAQYADQPMVLYYPSVVQNSNKPNGNNGNGGASQNSNF